MVCGWNRKERSMNAIKYALLGLYGIIGLLISTFGFFRVPFAESLAKQYYRYAIGGMVVVLLMLSVVVGVVILSFNANNFKTEIVRYVKEHTQRDLVLQGDIRVTFIPKLGLDTGKMSLSKRNSAREFASVNNVRLYIEWLPLLRRQLVFDQVVIDGAHVNLTRFKDGTTNFDDLLFREQSLAPVTFDIDNMRITNSSIDWQDEMKWQRVALQDLQVETGSLADVVPSHIKASFHLNSEVAHSDSNIAWQSRLFYDRKEGRVEFSAIDATLQGTASGFSNLDLKFKGDLDSHPAQGLLLVENMAVSATGNYGQRSIETSLAVPRLQLDKSVSSGSDLTLDASVSQFDEKWTARVRIPAFGFADKIFSASQLSADFDFKSNGGALQGKLSSPVSVDFGANPKFLLGSIAMELSAKHPMLSGELSANVKGSMQADLEDRNANLDFKATIDDSKIAGTVTVKDFSHPAYTINLDIDRLPLDRYIATEWIRRYQEDATRIDLSGIRDMSLTAGLHAGAMKLGRLEASKVSAVVNIEQSMLTIEPLTARIYGGTLAGSINLAAQAMPQITIKQNLTGIQAGALFAGSAGAGKLTGKGDMAVDLSAEGSKIGELRQSLNGSASLALANGSITGIDLRAALIEGKDDLGIKGGAHAHEFRFSEQTGYSGLKAVFNIKGGGSQGNSFEMRSAQFRVAGEGEFDFATGMIDYHLAATVAPALSRRSAGDLEALKGVTVPIGVSGPYTAPSITLDFAAASGEVVTKRLAARAASEQAAAKQATAESDSSTAKRAVPSKKHLRKPAKNIRPGPE